MFFLLSDSQYITLFFVSYCALCRLELPNGAMLWMKVKPNQTVRACLEPILSRQGLSSDHVIAHLVSAKKASYFVLWSLISTSRIQKMLVLARDFSRNSGYEVSCCKKVWNHLLNFCWTIAFPSYCVQVGCEVPLDPDISAATIEHNHVVVETEEQFTGNAVNC